jgi:predicted RNA binding protein YcfA (HicA-like mRNA interferase family)
MIRALRRAGWDVVDQEGSHLQLQHPATGVKVAVPVHANRPLKPGTQDRIMERAGLSDDDLRRLLGRK